MKPQEKKQLVKEYWVRNCIRLSNGDNYTEITAEDEINKFLADNPGSKVSSITAGGGDLNSVAGQRLYVIYEFSKKV